MEESGTIEADGFALRYSVEGEGQPAIVIGSAQFYPRVFSQDLRKHLKMVFLDHRGFATPPAHIPARSFELTTVADDIERARKRLGLDRVAIVGHSGHAYMALEYAKMYPAHVSHVVMIGIAPDLGPQMAQTAERYWQESVSPERKALLEENFRRDPDSALADLPAGEKFLKAYRRNAPKIWFDPRYDCAPLWEGVAANEVLFHLWGKVFPRIDITHRLETLEAPVLLALGRFDFLVAPPSSWDPMRKYFRDLTVRIFERSGHTPQLEEAELFDGELLTWMQKHS